MLEIDPAKPPRSTLQAFVGFLLGIGLALGCLALAFFVGITLQTRYVWVYPLLDAIALIAVGIAAMRRRHQSSYADGVLIALSIALLLDGVCAVGFGR